MHRFSESDILALNTPTLFTNVFREQVGLLLDVDLTDVADLPCSGTTKGKNLFARSLMEPLPDDIYNNIKNSDGSFALWLYRFGFTPRALNIYVDNYDRIHGKDTFPKQEFKTLIRRIKNCGYQTKSRETKKEVRDR
jgi:hypothetical protein